MSVSIYVASALKRLMKHMEACAVRIPRLRHSNSKLVATLSLNLVEKVSACGSPVRATLATAVIGQFISCACRGPQLS